MDEQNNSTTVTDPTQFEYVDITQRIILDGQPQFRKWQRVKRSGLPGAFKPWGDKELFCTVLSYPNPRHVEDEPKYGPLYFEFDAGKEGTTLEDVFSLADKLISHLTMLHELEKGSIRLWYSGGRSIHIEIDPAVLGIQPNTHLHIIYHRAAANLKKALNLKALDMNVYTSRRQWRYPNSRHHSGLYKIELDASELKKSVEEIQQMAARPRAVLYDNMDLEFEINPSAAAWIGQFAEEMEQNPPEDYDRDISLETNQPGLKHILDGCAFIAYCRENSATLSEPLWYAMISNLCRFKGGSEAIHELSAPYSGYSTRETDEKIRHALEASAPISCQKIRSEGFGCPKSCNVKSPAGLAYKKRGVEFVNHSENSIEESENTEKEIRFFNLTDMGNGERLAHYHGQDVRYCYPNTSWYIWDGSRWKVDKLGEIEKLAKDTSRRIYIEAGHCQDDEQRQATAKHAKSSESRYRKLAMIDMAHSEPGIPVLPKDLDSDGWLLNCLNGTLDLRTGELYSHKREDMITKVIPIEYDPNAKLELWDRFLETTTQGNEEFLGFLQRAVGYSLTGNTGEEVLFFIHGPTAAGKSTFVEAIKSVMGDYAVTADFEVFLQKYRDMGSPRNDVASLAGSRLVVSIEVQEGRRLAEGLVKMLTGGDTVRARFLYHESFEFLPEMKLWLCANHAPKVRADDTAIWRRILKLPFEHIVPEGERDPEVKATLKNPDIAGPAILAWAVQGCLRWQEYGLAIPEIVKQATAAYRKEMDILEAFIEDCCLIQPGVSVSKKDLYNEYKRWCEEAGEKAEGKINFGKRLSELRYQIESDSGTGNISIWNGIGIRHSDLLEGKN